VENAKRIAKSRREFRRMRVLVFFIIRPRCRFDFYFRVIAVGPEDATSSMREYSPIKVAALARVPARKRIFPRNLDRGYHNACGCFDMLRRALQKWHYPVTSLTTDLLHPDFAENLKAAQLVDRNCFRFIP
jgi:hypothetical protein